MTRKRIKHERLLNESKRNATFRKRTDSLLKKANELSILCGVIIGIIFHKQGGNNNSILWPSPAIFRERLEIFLNFSDMERAKRMVTNDKYMEQTVDDETENLLKFRKRTELKESQQLMNELVQDKYFDRLDSFKLNGLKSLADEMLKKLQKRGNELKDEQRQAQQLTLPYSLPVPLPPPPFLSYGIAVSMQQQVGGEASTSDLGGMGAKQSSHVPLLLENLRNEQWLNESISEEQDINTFFKVLPNNGGGAVTNSVGRGAKIPTGVMNVPPPLNNDIDKLLE